MSISTIQLVGGAAEQPQGSSSVARGLVPARRAADAPPRNTPQGLAAGGPQGTVLLDYGYVYTASPHGADGGSADPASPPVHAIVAASAGRFV